MKLRAVFCLALGLALSVCLAAGRTPPQPAAAETPATVDSSAVETAVRGPDSAAAMTAAESADSTAAAADSLAVDTLVSAPPAVAPDSTAALPVETDTLLKALAPDTAAILPDTAKAALPADTLERAGQLIAEATARENPRVLRFNAIYLNSGSVASNKLMDRFIERARKYSLGGFVMDMKDDHGYLSYTSRLPLAKKIGSNTRRVGDPASLVRRVHESGLTVTARVVCFKDRLLAGYSENGAFPFAVLDSTTGSPWKQDNGEIWANPYHPEVHGYLSGIVEELVSFGFDQVQLDYIRFPSDGNTDNCYYPVAIDSLNKAEVIGVFLSRVRTVLDTTAVSLAADVFGWVPWLHKDRNYWIGQDWDVIAGYADVICPMLYSSHFPASFKIKHGPLRAYNIVREGTEKGVERRGGRPTGVQPYIQCFDWNEPYFGTAYILQQIRAAANGGAVGWIAWNARNDYSALWEALRVANGISRSGSE